MTSQTDPTPCSSAPQTSAEDRRHPRISCGRKLALLLPSSCTRLTAWSYDASCEGIGFFCLQPIPDRTVFLQPEGTVGEAVEIELVRCRQVIDGLWECGAIVHRFVSETDVLFACASTIEP